jgi:hypothetical protein
MFGKRCVRSVYAAVTQPCLSNTSGTFGARLRRASKLAFNVECCLLNLVKFRRKLCCNEFLHPLVIGLIILRTSSYGTE